MAANVGMNMHGGGYNFGYATGDSGGHSRVESGNGGTVSGSYSYVDANGDRRTVQYSAGPQGFQASGDTGVDRKTAAAAAALNAMAPKAPAASPGAPAAHMGGAWQAPAGQWQAPAAQWQAPTGQWQAPASQWQAPASQWQDPSSFGAPNMMMSQNGFTAKW